MNNAMKEHWNKVYSSNDTTKLGWYEETPAPSIKLLSKCNISKDAAILDVGAGATTLIDYLVNNGYTNITAADISEEAIEKLKGRLGKEKSALVKWIVDDLTGPSTLASCGMLLCGMTGRYCIFCWRKAGSRPIFQH